MIKQNKIKKSVLLVEYVPCVLVFFWCLGCQRLAEFYLLSQNSNSQFTWCSTSWLAAPQCENYYTTRSGTHTTQEACLNFVVKQQSLLAGRQPDQSTATASPTPIPQHFER